MEKPELQTPKTIRFIADAMMGDLARQLVFAGYDCRYCRQLDDEQLAGLAAREDRVLLTMDRALFASVPASPSGDFLDTQSTREQMVLLTRSIPLKITEDQMFTRCVDCNRDLEPMAFEDVREEIPPETRQWTDEYSRCPECGKLYWKGTHTEAIRDRFERWGILPWPRTLSF